MSCPVDFPEPKRDKELQREKERRELEFRDLMARAGRTVYD